MVLHLKIIAYLIVRVEFEPFNELARVKFGCVREVEDRANVSIADEVRARGCSGALLNFLVRWWCFLFLLAFTRFLRLVVRRFLLRCTLFGCAVFRTMLLSFRFTSFLF